MCPRRESNQGLFGAWDHTQPTQPRQSGWVGDMIVDWCSWVKGGGGCTCHKWIFWLLNNPHSRPRLNRNICGVGTEEVGLGAPTENGGDSGSEIGRENTQQAPGSPEGRGEGRLEPPAGVFANWPAHGV